MLTGSGDPEERAHGAPTLEDFGTNPLTLPKASVLQVICEIASEPMCEMLPPALHPTLPPAVSWLVYDCPESPWGPLRLAQTRIECRSGTRPRALLVLAVTNNRDAGEALSARWGFRVRGGEVDFRRSYDEVRSVVRMGGNEVLDIGLRAPQPLGAGDIQFVPGMHPVNSQRGFRLLQCDPNHAESESQRGEPLVEEFDGEAWGDDRIEPVYPVSAAFATADITLPKLRFACRPGEMSFSGTETL
jgi:hypothetical protein